MPIQHVLLDADGVLQTVAGGWAEAAAPHVGDRGRELLQAFWSFEESALVGDGDVVDALARALDELGIDAAAAELYPLIWLDIDVLPTTHELVRRLRASGLGVHLGTNQTLRRAAHMRSALAYDDLFDVSVYSCDLGVAKPDPDYFVRATELIGAPADQILFVDDKLPNVEAARAVGLAGVHWHHGEGIDVLDARLAARGVQI